MGTCLFYNPCQCILGKFLAGGRGVGIEVGPRFSQKVVDPKAAAAGLGSEGLPPALSPQHTGLVSRCKQLPCVSV